MSANFSPTLPASSSSSSNIPPVIGVSPMLALYFWVVRTMETTARTADIQAKTWAAKTKALDEYNREAAALNIDCVPKTERQGGTVHAHSHWVILPPAMARALGHQRIKQFWYNSYSPVKTVNAADIEGVQASNQAKIGERQVVQQKMAVVQQQSSIDSAKIGTTTNLETTQLSFADSIRSTIQDLTKKATLNKRFF